MNLNEENKNLQQKNTALSNQLDKVTDQLFSAQEIATDLKNQLEEKKHSEQLGGWAIDRAIETFKMGSDKPTPQSVIDTAEMYCKWIVEKSAKTVDKITPKKRSVQ